MHEQSMYVHYEIPVSYDIYRTGVEELKVVEEEDKVFGVDGYIVEWLEVGAERGF